MPPIWRICATFPLAPEFDIIASEPVGSRAATRARWIWFVVSDQMLIVAMYFSSSVTRPIWNCSSSSSIFSSASAIIAGFSRGTWMSETAIVTPDCVA